METQQWASAPLLENGNLKNNSHIEIYWKESRNMMADIPNRLKFPNVYFSKLKNRMRRLTTNMEAHKLVPNLKHRKKTSVRKTNSLSKDDTFIPSALKRTKKAVDESYGGSSEIWKPKKSKTNTPTKPYMKFKSLDFLKVEKLIDPENKKEEMIPLKKDDKKKSTLDLNIEDLALDTLSMFEQLKARKRELVKDDKKKLKLDLDKEDLTLDTSSMFEKPKDPKRELAKDFEVSERKIQFTRTFASLNAKCCWLNRYDSYPNINLV